uniref:Putative RepA replicase protein n=1 Tax=Rhodothermus marinus TaxID=29549 RepID=Q52874_RHOMR|nr:replication protein RepA [Rhodothermus marinus]AAA20550.1 putative RepA replicase protein [Rhodothermus marinus]
MPRTRALDALLKAAREIAEQDAREADAIAYMARLLTQATIPHREPRGQTTYRREAGDLVLEIQGREKYGLPYGSYPRLLLAWMCTEAVKTRSRKLYLGASLSEFMDKLGLVPSGGRWGTIPRLRDQAKRLFFSRWFVDVSREMEAKGWRAWWDLGFQIALSRSTLLWDVKDPDQLALFEEHSYVELTQEFFEAVLLRPVPLDARALRALKQSPLALDLYAWLSYRASYAQKDLAVTWQQLHAQFGADYENVDEFARKVKQAIAKIHLLWPDLRVQYPKGRLVLKATTQVHVPRAIGSNDKGSASRKK